MGRRLEDDIAELRREIAAFENWQRPLATSPEEEAKWLEVAGYMDRGEEVPEELLDEVDPLRQMRDFLPVVQEMLEEGLFDASGEHGEGHDVVEDP